ncbi:MAG TPA: DUF2939 domain-containing protein [Myxococcota bacterium]|nr:DUF2939 domain-containing protein [Myxococcota bacterium]
MSKRSYALPLLAGLVILVGSYVASPWWATSRMRKAAEAGDGERLAQYVDYPALRASLSTQIQGGLVGKPREGEPPGPFAAFGQALAGKLASAAVEALVTPGSIAAMIDRGRAGDVPSVGEGSDEEQRSRIERRRHYVGLDEFEVDMHDAETKGHLITLVFHRERGFFWKLAGIRVPETK